MSPYTVAAAAYAVMSLVTFAAFALDKRAARGGRRRVPERTLHTLELFGGWPGALLAMRLVRHKNRKAAYLAPLALIIVLHVALWGVVLWQGSMSGT